MHLVDKQVWTTHEITSGKPPLARFGHTAVEFDNHIYMFGGKGISDDMDTGTTLV